MSSKTFFRMGDRYTAVSTNDDRVVEIKNKDKHDFNPSYFTNIAEWRASLPAITADRELQTSQSSAPPKRTIDPSLRDGALVNALMRHFHWHYGNVYYLTDKTIGEFIVKYEEDLKQYKAKWVINILAELYKLRERGVPLTQLYAKGYREDKIYVMDDSELMPLYYRKSDSEYTLMYKGRIGKTCAELGVPCDSDGRPVVWIQRAGRIYKLDYSTVL
jgi:hypothetical protein